jgi:hypothetical protein
MALTPGIVATAGNGRGLTSHTRVPSYPGKLSNQLNAAPAR